MVRDPSKDRRVVRGRGRRAAAATLAAVLAAVALTPVAGAQDGQDTRVIDFESSPSGISGGQALPVGTIDGVVFDDRVVGLQFGEDSDPPLTDLARSPRTVAGDCYAEEFCTNDIRGFFRVPVTGVEVFVGSRQPLPNGGVASLQALDSTRQPFGEVAVIELPASDSHVPAVTGASVTDPLGRIGGFRVTWLEGGGDGLVIDDLTLVAPLAELTAEFDAAALDASSGPVTTQVAFRNTGTIALTVTNAAVDVGTAFGPGEFSIEQDGCLSATLLPGEACVALVQFASTTVGESGAQIVAVLDTGETTAAAPVSGFAVAPPSTPPPTPTDTPTPSPTPTATATPTETAGNGGPPPPTPGAPIDPRLVVGALVVLAVLVGALVARAASRRTPRTPATRPRVSVTSPPYESELVTGDPDVAISVRLAPSEGTTTIEEGNET